MVVVWYLVYGCLITFFLSAIVLWLVPKKWIMRSAATARTFPLGAPPPWKSLRRLGQIAWIGVYLSGVGFVVVLAIGALLEVA
jgi:hypothetical protein